MGTVEWRPGRHSPTGVPAFAAYGYRRDVVGDAELAVAAAGGNRAALSAIYDRYADTLYELCRVILRDPHEARDALQDTFVIAATRMGGLRDPERLKPWLCAIARRESIRRSSKRARNRPSHDEGLDVPVTDDTVTAGAEADETAALVWAAAESLTERERSLLVLNVRQGLEGAELADAAGLPGATASVVLTRAKSQLALAVRTMLLIRNGRSMCTELAAIAPSGARRARRTHPQAGRATRDDLRNLRARVQLVAERARHPRRRTVARRALAEEQDPERPAPDQFVQAARRSRLEA